MTITANQTRANGNRTTNGEDSGAAHHLPAGCRPTDAQQRGGKQVRTGGGPPAYDTSRERSDNRAPVRHEKVKVAGSGLSGRLKGSLTPLLCGCACLRVGDRFSVL
jgi:hypothetical protein